MDIGIKIKQLRERNRLSQSELAHRLDISQSKLSNIENGTTKAVGFALLDKVCQTFDVGYDYFAENKQVHKVKHNHGGVAGNNYGTINNHTDVEIVLDVVKKLMQEFFSNLEKDLRDKS